MFSKLHQAIQKLVLLKKRGMSTNFSFYCGVSNYAADKLAVPTVCANAKNT